MKKSLPTTTNLVYKVQRYAKRFPDPIYKFQKPILKSALRSGRRGEPDATLYIDEYSAKVRGFIEQVLEPVRSEYSIATAQLASVNEELNSFDTDKKARGIETKSTAIKNKRHIAITANSEELYVNLDLARKTVAEKEDVLFDLTDKYGPVPSKKSWLDKHARLQLLAVGLFDSAFTYTAFTESGYSPMFAIALAIGVGFILAGAGAGLARSVFKSNYLKAAGYGLVSAGVITTLISFRTGDNVAVFGALLILAFLGSTLFAHRQAARKALFDAAEDVVKAYADMAAISNQLGNLSEENSLLDSTYADQAKEEALNYEEGLLTEKKSLSNTVAVLKAEIDSKVTYGEERIKEGVAAINAAFNKGKQRRIQLPQNSIIQKLGLFLAGGFMLVSQGCMDSALTPTEVHAIMIAIDKSGSMISSIEEQADDICRVVCDEKLDLSEENFLGQKSVTIYIYIIGDYSVPKRVVVELSLGEPFAVRDIPKRRKEIELFKKELYAAVKEALESNERMQATELHRGLSHGFEQLVESASTHRSAICITDCLEEGSVVKLTSFKTPQEIREAKESVIDILLKDHDLPDLSGVKIMLLAKSRPHTHSTECIQTGVHTTECAFGNDPFCFEAAKLFEDMWTRSGAEVTLIRNL